MWAVNGGMQSVETDMPGTAVRRQYELEGVIPRVVIGVWPPSALSVRTSLWRALRAMMPLSFVACEDPREYRGDSLIVFKEDVGSPVKFPQPYCLVIGSGEGPKIECEDGPVEFAGHPSLHDCFRGQRLSDPNVRSVLPLRLQRGDYALAAKGGLTLWSRRETDGAVLETTAVCLPALTSDTYVFEYFHESNFFALLPLLHFVRSRVIEAGWMAPRARACFMIDDPNLHRTKYGYVDYAKIARHAERNRYHISFATIPLDSWFIHEPAVRLFRQNASTLSLLMHGNNHTKDELALEYTHQERSALLAQALQRIGKLERRSGIEVSRVMAPPHGGCSEAMMGGMFRLGFEAACISYGSLRAYNRACQWTRAMGLGMAENIAGLPIIPRFSLEKSSYLRVLLCAFLNQPIILMGHHMDFAGGLDVLERYATWINSIRDVQWSNMKDIARTNYYFQRVNGCLNLSMYTRLAEINILPDTHNVSVAVNRIDDAQEMAARWDVLENRVREGPGNRVLPAEPGSNVQLTQSGSASIDFRTVAGPKPQLWPVLRRALTEGRDRFLPISGRIPIVGRR